MYILGFDSIEFKCMHGSIHGLSAVDTRAHQYSLLRGQPLSFPSLGYRTTASSDTSRQIPSLSWRPESPRQSAIVGSKPNQCIASSIGITIGSAHAYILGYFAPDPFLHQMIRELCLVDTDTEGVFVRQFKSDSANIYERNYESIISMYLKNQSLKH